MSWFAQGVGLVAHPVFAAVARMPRRRLDDYISSLQSIDTSIRWPWLKLPVEVEQARNRVGMQWADIAGRAMLRATTPEATRYTLRMLKGAANDWDHLGWCGQVREVLIASSRTTDPEALDNRKAIVDHYVGRGDYEFRALIQP